MRTGRLKNYQTHGEEKGWESLLNHDSLWGDEKVLEIDTGDGCPMLLTCSLKHG